MINSRVQNIFCKKWRAVQKCKNNPNFWKIFTLTVAGGGGVKISLFLESGGGRFACHYQYVLYTYDQHNFRVVETVNAYKLQIKLE